MVGFKFRYVDTRFLGIKVSSVISIADNPGLLLYQGDMLGVTRMLWKSELSGSGLRSRMSRTV